MSIKKKILIVSSAFYPENSPRSFRTTELAKELVRTGHAVKLITHARYGTEKYCLEHGIQFKNLGEIPWSNNKEVKGNLIKVLFYRAVARLSKLLFEYPMIKLAPLVKRALSGETGFDMLISIAMPYPIHWGVAIAWSKDKTKNVARLWIADCGDPYCLQENDTFRPPFYFRWIEKWFMRKADYISVPTQNSYKGYFPEFHPKLRVISQGFRFEDVEIKPVMKDGVIRFGYGGEFIKGRRDPTEFLAYLSSLNKSIKFEFYIYTNKKEFILPFVSDSRIKLQEPISRLDMLSLFSSFNFVVNFTNRGLAQTPSKLIDYAIIKRPILNIQTGVLRQEVILQFFNGDYQSQFIINQPEQYKIEAVANLFLKLS